MQKLHGVSELDCIEHRCATFLLPMEKVIYPVRTLIFPILGAYNRNMMLTYSSFDNFFLNEVTVF